MMVAKSSFVRTRSDASRAASVPPRPIEDADVRAPQSGCVVDPVPSDRDDLALGLPALHQAKLLLRRHPRVHDLGR